MTGFCGVDPIVDLFQLLQRSLDRVLGVIRCRWIAGLRVPSFAPACANRGPESDVVISSDGGEVEAGGFEDCAKGAEGIREVWTGIVPSLMVGVRLRRPHPSHQTATVRKGTRRR